MFTCDFSKRGTKGLCEFLTETIREKILTGTLKPDEKLPSKRALSSHLGISVITVQNCYSELISEGYIYSIEKCGFFVTKLPEKITPSYEKKNQNEKININLCTQKPENKIFVDFSNNQTSYEKFPFSAWSKASRNILNRPHEDLLKPQPAQGSYILRTEICKHLKDFRELDVTPEQIIVGTGTEALYTKLVQLLGMKKKVAVENPGYKKISAILNLSGVQTVPIDIDKEGLNVKKLTAENADIVHVTPNHHFPTGSVIPVRRRMELLSWAAEKDGRLIIEDDYDSEFRFNGKPIPPLFYSDKNNCVIYMNTFAKTLSPSFRISYMVLPPPLAKLFSEKLAFLACTVSAFEQYTLALFMAEGHFSRHIIRMKNYYRSIRNNLITQIKKSSLNQKSKILESDAGLHFLLSLDINLCGEKLKSQLLKNEIAVRLLSDYYYDENTDEKNPDASKTIVINYSGLEKEKIPEAVKKLADAI